MKKVDQVKFLGHQPQAEATPRPTPRRYQAPQVTDLGHWNTMTLLYSVPFNGSNALNPFGEQQ